MYKINKFFTISLHTKSIITSILLWTVKSSVALTLHITLEYGYMNGGGSLETGRDNLEIEVVLSAMAGRLSPQLAPQFVQLVDWSRVIALSQQHRVVWHVMTGLSALISQLPDYCRADCEKCLARLKNLHIANAARCTILENEMFRIGETFSVAGIKAIAWKGIPLGVQAYGDPAARQFDDLDYLVAQDRIIEARNVLLTLGYLPMLEFSDAEQRAHIKAGWGCGMKSATGNIFVEINSNAVPGYFQLHSERLQADNQLEEVKLSGRSIRTVAAPAALILLSAHGVKHLWERLSWIADIGGLIQQKGNTLDWDKLLEAAGKSGAKRMLLMGLGLARNVVGTELPAGIEKTLKTDSHAAKLSRHTMEALKAGRSPEKDRRIALRFHLRTRERLRDRAAMILHLAFTPSYADWKALPLPGPLFPLYRIFRPFRLLFHRW